MGAGKLFLVICAILSASPALNPLIPLWGNRKNGYPSANQSRNIVRFDFDQRLGQIDAWKADPISACSHVSNNRGRLAEFMNGYRLATSALFHWFHERDWFSVRINRIAKLSDKCVSVFDAEKRNIHEPLPKEQSVVFWIGRSNLIQERDQEWTYCTPEQIYSFRGAGRSPTGLSPDSKDIESDVGIPDSAGREKAATDVNNLAAKMFPILGQNKTVGSYSNPVAAPDDHNRRSPQYRRTSHETQNGFGEPFYLRKADPFATVTMIQEGVIAEDVEGHDFDASCDGLTWVHFTGPVCLGHLPSYHGCATR
jgi:hypothetical protein